MKRFLRPLYATPEPGGWLTGLGWLWTLLPSASSSPSLSSPLLPLSLPLLNCSAALTDSTPPTGMQRGRSAAWKWHHHASCGSIHPFPSCPPCFFFTRCRRAEPYGITRRMKVGVLGGWCEAGVEGEVGWLGCALADGCWMGRPAPRFHSPGKERSGAADAVVKCSAPLWIMHREKRREGERKREGKNCWSRFSFRAYWH